MQHYNFQYFSNKFSTYEHREQMGRKILSKGHLKSKDQPKTMSFENPKESACRSCTEKGRHGLFREQ